MGAMCMQLAKTKLHMVACIFTLCFICVWSTWVYGATTLNLPGAYTIGLGGASATGLADTGLTLRNPAGLAALSDNRFVWETYWVDGMQAHLLGLLQENQNGWSGGLYMMYMDGQGSDDYFDFGYAVAAGPWNGLSLGVTAHYMKGAKINEAMSGWSLDVGALQDFGVIRLGASMRNAWSGGAGVTYNEETGTGVPQEIRAGIAIDLSAVELRLDAVKVQDAEELVYAGGLSIGIQNTKINGGVTKEGDTLAYSCGFSLPFKTSELTFGAQWENGSKPVISAGLTYRF